MSNHSSMLRFRPEVSAREKTAVRMLTGVGGTHDILYFRTGVCHFMVSTSTLSGIFDEKVGPFRNFCA